ncbi:MAG: PaaI family thioesterase [Alphaproteobacteria bacterium]
MDESVLTKIRHIIGGNLGASLRMVLEDAGDDRCILQMPTDGTALNARQRVHGGAIAALIDTAATGAAWACPELGPNARGTTVSISINYQASPQGDMLRAAARVTRRGRSMVFLEISVTDSNATAIAHGIVSYKLDPGSPQGA